MDLRWLVIAAGMVVLTGCGDMSAPSASSATDGSSQSTAITATTPTPSATADPTPLPDGLNGVGLRFLAFARGELDIPPIDTPVDLYVDRRFVQTISSEQTGDQRAYRVCGRADGYAGRTCPFSAVGVLAGYDGEITVTTHPPSHPCLHLAQAPEELVAYRTLVLTATASLTCVDYFAVELSVNDVGQIVAVHTLLTEP
jgi:hypothetical protein